MFREVITPSADNHNIELPKKFFGKKVEVFAFELDEPVKKKRRKRTSKNAIKQLVGAFTDFPSLDTIRKKAWPERW